VRPYLKAIVVIDTGIPAVVVDADRVFVREIRGSRRVFIPARLLHAVRLALNVYEGCGVARESST